MKKNSRTFLSAIHYPMSIVEYYISEDGETIYEVNCLPENICKEYSYPVYEFLNKTGRMQNSLKEKITQYIK